MNTKGVKMTKDEIIANIDEMNSGTMHEIDQLVMMVDTQRSIIKLLQSKINGGN